MKIQVTALFACILLLTAQIRAQDTTDEGFVSWGRGYGDNTRVVVLTETAVHLATGKSNARLLATNGLLIKTGKTDAVGFAMVLSLDEKQSFTPELRYRHWFNRGHFVDVGIGIPHDEDDRGNDWNASPSFLLKWHPVETLGFALRPEYRHRSRSTYQRDADGRYQTRRIEEGEWFLSGGVEICGPSGFAIEALAASILAVGIGLAFSN